MFDGVDPGFSVLIAQNEAVLPMESAAEMSENVTEAQGLLISLELPPSDVLFMSRDELDLLLGDMEMSTASMDNDQGTIIVTGWSNYDGGGGGWGGGGWDSNYNPSENGGGGGQSSNPYYAQTLNHYETCASDDGAAVQIAATIMLTNNVYGPPEYDWTRHEYSSLVGRGQDGRYGALDALIYTRGGASNSSVPMPDGSIYVAGLIHNHPDFVGKTHDEDLEQRYPSERDWEALVTLHNIYVASNSGYDPSLWLLDRWGIVREFKLSERASIEVLDDAQRRAGIGLAGRERTSSCT